VYLYRAIDCSGVLIDVMQSETRDMAAANVFFRAAKTITGISPVRVTTDGRDSYPRAVRTEPGRHVRYRRSRYLTNRLEQDHRGIKGRYRPARGSSAPAQRHGSAEATTNSALAHTMTSLSPPTSGAGTSPARPQR